MYIMVTLKLFKHFVSVTMKKLPISKHEFSDLIEENCIYIDKTKLIHDLITGNGHKIFLSRPRRFGKSLLISTLSAIFEGKSELFKGLYNVLFYTMHPNNPLF